MPHIIPNQLGENAAALIRRIWAYLIKNRYISNPLHDRRDEHRIHLRDGAVLTAKVFQRGAEMIEFLVVENQKTVVKGSDSLDLQSWILFVELFYRSRCYWRLSA